MKLRIEPITLTLIAIFGSWFLYQATDKPVCQVYVEKTAENPAYYKPVYCEDLAK